jgi:hypothetical protein
MSYATVMLQFVTSFGAFLAEHFDVFQAVSKGFTAKTGEFGQLHGCICKLVCVNRETINES